MIRIQTALNMIMMRSKRACRLTAGKFASVDLPTFLAVCRFYFIFFDSDESRFKQELVHSK